MTNTNEKLIQSVEARTIDTSEFAEKYNIDIDVVRTAMRNCRSCSYVTNPLQAVEEEVEKFKIKNKENLIRFIYFNLFNRPIIKTRGGKRSPDFYRW